MKRFIKYFLIFLVSLFLAFWLALSNYFVEISNYFLGSQGWKIETLDIDVNNMGSFFIKKLSMKQKAEENVSLSLDLHDAEIEVEYFPFKLIKLEVDAAHFVDHRSGTVTKGKRAPSKTPAGNPLEKLADFSLSKLPFESIQIKKLFYGQPSAMPAFLAFSVQIENRQKTLKAEINSIIDELVSFNLEINELEDSLNLQLKQEFNLTDYRLVIEQALKKKFPGFTFGTKKNLRLNTLARAELYKTQLVRSNLNAEINVEHPAINNSHFRLVENDVKLVLDLKASGFEAHLKSDNILDLILKEPLLTFGDMIEPSAAPISIKIDSQNLNFSFSLWNQQLSSKGSLSAAIKSELADIAFKFSELNAKIKKEISVSTAIKVNAKNELFAKAPVSFSSSELKLKPIVAISQDAFKVSLLEKGFFSVKGLEQRQVDKPIRIDNIDVSIDQTTNLLWSRQTQNLAALNSDINYSSSDFDLKIFPEAPFIAKLAGQSRISDASIDIKHSTDFESVKARLSTPVSINLKSGSVQGSFLLEKDHQIFSRFKPSWIDKSYKDLVKKLRGELSLEGNFTSKLSDPIANLKLKGQAELKDVGAKLAENSIRLLNMPISFSWTQNEGAYAKTDLDIARIKIGEDLDLQGLKLSSELKNNILSQSAMTTNILGSPLAIDDFSFNLADPKFKTFARFEALDLSKLDDLLNLDGLQLEGKVSGELPLIFADKTLAIEKGQLTNTLPGTIKYQPEGKLDTICLELNNLQNVQRYALQNYQFQLLKVNVDFDGKQTVSLPLRLAGKNPNFCSGRAINLNVNLNYTLPENFWVYFLFGDDFIKNIRNYQDK